MRILAATHHFVGHVTGVRGLLRQAEESGHECLYLFLSPPGHQLSSLLEGIRVIHLGAPPRKSIPNFAAIYRNRESVRRLAWGMTELHPELIEHVERLLLRERIDLVVTDSVSIWALVAAARAGVRCINVPAGFAPFFTARNGVEFEAADEFAARRTEVFARFGLPPHLWIQNYVVSPDLNLAMSVQEFLGASAPRVSCPFVAVGPLLPEPYETMASRPLPAELPAEHFVFVCFGTLVTGELSLRAIKLVTNACRQLGVPCVVAKGNLALKGTVDAQVHDFLPLDVALQRSVVYVGAAGMNSVNSALLAGVPILSFPLYFDQFDSALLVERSGAGLTLNAETVSAEEVTGSLQRLLCDPAFKAKALGIGQALQRAAGAGLVSHCLVKT